MKRAGLALGVVLLVGLGGCLAAPGTGPTQTATATPAGVSPTPEQTPTPDLDWDLDCLRYGNLTVDLAALNGSRSIGAYSVPASAVAEYALVVRDVDVTLENGTTVSDVYAEHFRAHTARDQGSQTVGVEIDVRSRPDDATPRPVPRDHPNSPYEAGSSEFAPGTVEPPVPYALATGGNVSDGGQVTVRVTREGAPIGVPLEVVGGANGRYRTGADRVVSVRITSPEVVEIEATIDES
jgi:hypothetical protein